MTHFCSSYLGTAPHDLQIKITTNKAPNNLNMFALSLTIFFSSQIFTFACTKATPLTTQELNNILMIFSVLYENDVTIRQF